VENDQPSGRRPEQIDFPVLWFLTRGAQVLVAVIFAKMAYVELGTNSFSLDLFSFIGMFLMIWAFCRRVATGTADSSGIHYRLNLRLKTVAWAEVQEIQWVGFKLRVVIKRATKRNRVLVFLLNPLKSTGAYWAHRLGVDVLPPEILERIRALPIESPPTMASAPLYPKWLIRIFLGVMALFVLVFLWRLLSVAPGASH
jgi:hypothetical protein